MLLYNPDHSYTIPDTLIRSQMLSKETFTAILLSHSPFLSVLNLTRKTFSSIFILINHHVEI